MKIGAEIKMHRRLWMKAKTQQFNDQKHLSECKLVAPGDVPALANLMFRAYKGTVDQEEENVEQCTLELGETINAKYGPFIASASFVLYRNSAAISASLLTHYKGRPLLAYSMTDPDHQGVGHAANLIRRSMAALHALGESELFLVVTDGNKAAQNLYAKIGFKTLGEAVPGQPPPT